VLASRLSEDPNVSVLVIEAGGDQRGILETKVPLTFGKLFHGVNDWDYFTTPQSEVDNRELFWPRGKMIGGSSSMNAMMHHHCSHSDFDEWEAKSLRPTRIAQLLT
jgi:choline dehydrogenase